MFFNLFLNCFVNNSEISLLLLLLVFVLILCVYNTNYFRIMYYLYKIPGPKSYPIIGIVYLLVGKTHSELSQIMYDIINQFTPIVKGYLGPLPLVFVSSPEYVEKILTDPDALEKSWLMTHIAVDIAGDSIVTASVPKWRRNRRKVVRAFAPNIIKANHKVIVENSLKLCNKLEGKINDSKSFDIFQYLSRASMDSLSKSILGVDERAQDNESTMYNAVRSVFQITFDRIYKPWLLIDPIFYVTKNFQKLSQNKNYITKRAEKIISEKRIENMTRMQNNNNFGMEFFDKNLPVKSLTEILLEVTKNDPLFDDKQLRDEIIFMIITGYDSTSNALSYMLLNLAANQNIQQKVWEELSQVLGDSKRVINLDDLSKFKYMDMVMKESMRLHPTIPQMTRKINKDIKLGNYLIPRGTTIIIPVMNLHRNENVWKDPLKFDPERFTPENIKDRHPYAYIPFSAGRRKCLGYSYAWMVMKTVLATLLSRYEFYTDLNINELQFEFHLSLKLLGGYPVRLKQRTTK